MKTKTSYFLAAAAVVAFATAAFAQNVSNYITQGGATWTVGGLLEVPTGGTLQLDSGSTLTLQNGYTFSTTGSNTFGAGSAIISKTSTSSTDINPPFDNRILGNPVSKTVVGTCTVAAVNADTCVILTGVTSRTISVTHFDIVAAGSAATCTGVLLEDNNGSPVVVATLAAATLTSAAHNVPLAATLGVGFGAGSGLTVAKGLQLDVNGSGCTTTTAFKYAVTYTIQ